MGVVVSGAVLSATLYAVAYVQVRRRLPNRATEYLLEALVTAAGAVLLSWADGWGPVMLATAPACVAASGFLAGKGSVAVLLLEDGEKMPPVVVWLVVAVAMG